MSYSSPKLPGWLAWNGEVLSGVPPPEAQSCDVTVEARVSGSYFLLLRMRVEWRMAVYL